MAVTYTKALLGKEDVQWHVPGTDSTSPTVINRLNSAGAVAQPITKVSAQDVPLLDAVVLANSLKPFEALANGPTTKTVELALKELRKNQYPVKNFQFYGGFEGTGITNGQADQNRLLFDQLVADIPSTGGSIFFPPGQWLFDGTAAGSPVLAITSKSNITLMGAGFGSNVRAFNAASGTDLLKFTNCSNITAQNMAFDVIDVAGGASLNFVGSVGNQISQIRVFNVKAQSGTRGVVVDGGGGHANGFWIENCYLLTSGFGLVVSDATLGKVSRNLSSLAAGTGGFFFEDGASASAVLGALDIELTAFVGAGTQNIQILRGGTYDATIHKDVRASKNRLNKGILQVAGMNNVDLSNNELLFGGISYTVDSMASVANFRSLYNYTQESSSNGLSIDVSNGTMDDFEIVGGRYYKSQANGILVNVGAGGTLRNGRIGGVEVLDNNQVNGTNSGIKFVGAGGTLIEKNQMAFCIARSTGAPKQQYGFHSTSGGTVTNNFFFGLIPHGYTTVPGHSLTGWAANAAAGVDPLGA